jgi:protein involved in polysaccharide export with SLBB domain
MVHAAAGGLTLEANTSNIEVTSNVQGEGHQDGGRSGTERVMIDFRDTDPATVAMAPGDAVRVNQKFRKTEGQSVMIIGEVSHPGRYDLLPGDTLGKLLERAGSITDHAYPPGAIFSRESDRKAEEARFRAAARELERAVAAASEKKDNPPDTQQIAMARDLANELREVEAVGRITVEADPTVLKTNPAQDILLEPGDKIYIPRRPLTVRVHGEVLSPANLQFRESKKPTDYIAEAGGMTYYADDDRTFVLYPDGSAQPLMVSAWNHKATFIPPGSTIVVPRDPKPFDFLTSARDFTQILSNLAITGIFISDLGEDD